jgi:hypothetical protein
VRLERRARRVDIHALSKRRRETSDKRETGAPRYAHPSHHAKKNENRIFRGQQLN